MVIQVAVTQNVFFLNEKRWFAIFNQAYQLNQWSYGFKIFTTHYPIIRNLMFKKIIELE